MTTNNPLHDEFVHETANDRFKSSFGSWFWGSMIAATVLHFGLLVLSPEFTAGDVSLTADQMENIEIPHEFDVPPPPEQLRRPAKPVVAEANIDEDLTIRRTTFDANPPEELLPPSQESDKSITDGPVLVPHDTPPAPLNQDEVQRKLRDSYPPLLRDAGIGGVVTVWLLVNEQGGVDEAQVKESSNHPQLDAAALEVAETYRFSPAMNRDEAVAVWVSIPIRFEVGR